MPTLKLKNEYSISILGAIEILQSQVQISAKSIVKAEYYEEPEDSQTTQWWKFTITEEEKDFQKYKLSLQTEKVYLAGQSQAFKDEDEEAWETLEDEDAIAYCLLPSSNHKANTCSLAFLQDMTDVPF